MCNRAASVLLLFLFTFTFAPVHPTQAAPLSIYLAGGGGSGVTIPPISNPEMYFGHSVAVSGATLLVGSPGINNYRGEVRVYIYDGEIWTYQQTLLPSAAVPADTFFGVSIALQGDTAVIGAPANFLPNILKGQVYIFTRQGSTWTQTAILSSPDNQPSDHFGWSVAIEKDVIVVGASSQKIGTNAYQGKVFRFVKPAGGWSSTNQPQNTFTASDGRQFDYFGWAVAINNGRILVGAPEHDINLSQNLNEGAAYLYSPGMLRGTWKETKLTAVDAAQEDGFGNAVALGPDEAFVGAPDDSVGQLATLRGSIYVFPFRRSLFSFQIDSAKKLGITQTGPESNYSNIHLGTSLAYAGQALVAGAPGSLGPTNVAAGSVFLYTKPATGWVQTSETSQYMPFQSPENNDTFGQAVASDGRMLAVGDPFINPGGLVYTFTNPINLSTYHLTVLEGADSGGSFDVTLGGVPNETVTVTLSSDARIHLSRTQLTFQPGNWNISQPVSLTAASDVSLQPEALHSVFLMGSSADTRFNDSSRPLSVILTEGDKAVYLPLVQ